MIIVKKGGGMFRFKFRLVHLLVATTLMLEVTASSGFPSIYPTGTTIYDPDRAWNGYTIYATPENKGGVLIDMNGNVIRRYPSEFRIEPQ